MLSVAARWGQRTGVSFGNGVITGLVNEQGTMACLLKTCHNTDIDLNTCIVFLHDTNEGVLSFPLEYGNIWNECGLQRKR